jgi:hypothetical protein
VPDDKDVGNAGNGVPAPLLGGAFLTESSEQTGQDHDQIGNNGHDDVSTRHASQQTKVEEQQRSGQAPVDVAGPEDLAVHLVESIGNVVVLLTDGDLLDGDTVSGGHCEVRDGGEDGDHGRDGVVETLRLMRALAGSRQALKMSLTSGTLHDRAVKAADAMIMSTKTTHSVFLPESPMNWSSGVVGTTEGMGATLVGELVGTGRREVFFKTSSNVS